MNSTSRRLVVLASGAGMTVHCDRARIERGSEDSSPADHERLLATARELVGCYRISFHRLDSHSWTLDPASFTPSQVFLDSLQNQYSGGFELRAAPGTRLPKGTADAWRASSWSPTGSDSVQITWSDGFGGVRLALTSEADSLIGTAHTYSDVPSGPLESQSRAVVSRITCVDPDSSRSEARRP
jgi:hypothetical protein